ncbi:MAG: DUF1311 domain-containing protein [Clostridiaceae bacterium]|nr:DUF1311 domain-containing protein [Clostridiaceae bacterium]
MKNKKRALLMVIALSMIMLAACTKDTKKTQNNIIKADISVSTNETTVNKNIQETNTTKTVTKIDGRREEFLGRLDSIQKQLDDLPVKKDSDAGITNAMKSYYGESYDMYDEALNEIYNLLKEQLSQNTMKNLQTEQVKWIAQKEDTANKEASEFKGGTFEYVAYSKSLYGTTKNRCYELVNNYMTDSKMKINASKQNYINKLDNIESKILSSQEYKNAETGVTRSMVILTDKEYNEWDGALNEIYNLLKQQLSSDEVEKLDKEEAQWITQKENKAKKSEEPQGIGSQLGNIAYKASLAHTTQSRCYELVYRYMK